MFKRSLIFLRVSLCGLVLCVCSCGTTRPPIIGSAGPITYQHVIQRDPNLSVHIVRVNLKDPRVSIHVSRGGPDPDGDGPWLTTLLPTSEVAEREKYSVAINGDFFEAQATKDIEGRNTGYIRGKPAAPVGVAMTDGVLWHRAASARPYLEITASKVARIVAGKPSEPVDVAAREIVGGGQILVRDGQAVVFTNRFALVRNPRTAVGIDASGTQLTFLVVDGRQPWLSIGMSLGELSQEMVRLGCAAAINLDGGGSSTMVCRDPVTNKPAVVNSPSDTRERAVADVLGVSLKAR